MDILEKRQQAHTRAELIRRLNAALPREGEAQTLPVVASYNGTLEISNATLSRILCALEG